MQIFNAPHRFGAIGGAVQRGVYQGEIPGMRSKGAARSVGLFVHISAGLAVLPIVVVRVLWRLVDPPPPPVVTPLGARLDRAGRFTHMLIYVLLVAVPVVGIVTQFARGQALPLSGLREIASPWGADRAFAHSVKEVHEFLANALLAVAAVHAAAALAHHWIFRDRTLKRMLPGKPA